MEDIKITIAEPKIFFDENDEKYFFMWLKQIVGQERFIGASDGLILTLPPQIQDVQFKKLIALFSRYKIPLHPLRELCHSHNESWVRNEEAYWYQSMFKED